MASKTLQVKILERFLSEKALKGLYEEYRENCKRKSIEKEVTPTDKKIYKEYIEGGVVSELCKKYKRGRMGIYASVALVVRSKKRK